MLATIRFYDVVVFLHVMAAIVAFGTFFAYPVMEAVAMQRDKRDLPYFLRAAQAVNLGLTTPAMIVLLITGIYQQSDGPWDGGAAWINVTFLILIGLFGLVHGFFGPNGRRRIAAAERDIASAGDGEVVLGEEYRRLERQAAIAGSLAGLLVLIAVFLMVVKPGA